MKVVRAVQRKCLMFGKTTSSLAPFNTPSIFCEEWHELFLLIESKEGNRMQALLLTSLDQKTTPDSVIEGCRVYYPSFSTTFRPQAQQRYPRFVRKVAFKLI
jgi:hypothetical protein